MIFRKILIWPKILDIDISKMLFLSKTASFEAVFRFIDHAILSWLLNF
jgi:hypothetical protein